MTVLVIILAILLGAALVALFFLYRVYARCRRELQRTTEERARLERERPTLAHMTRHLADDETRQLIRYRYNLLGRILAAEVAGDSSRIDEILEEVDALVADRNEFLRQTRLVYERMQPQMTGHLRERGLTDRQVEICCLYALGLNGKTIQQYTRDGRHFQHVGHIRKKLGLGEHDRNIDGYIRSLLK
jgi:hypothetical protein